MMELSVLLHGVEVRYAFCFPNMLVLFFIPEDTCKSKHVCFLKDALDPEGVGMVEAIDDLISV
jgi:hypothetical protein